MNFFQKLFRSCFSTQTRLDCEPPILQTTLKPKIQKILEDQRQIELKSINGETYKIKVKNEMTILELKKHISSSVNDQLPPKLMNLCVAEKIIDDETRIDSLPLSQNLSFIQMKVDLAQVSKIKSDPEGEDKLTNEIGTTKMSCGHEIGRDSMTMLIKNLIEQKEYQIKCPNKKEDDTPCNQIWDFAICKKIAVLTKSERQEFESGLTMNLIQKQTKQCPECKQAILKDFLAKPKSVCPHCDTQFCYNCNRKWVGQDKQYCESEQCNFLQHLLRTCEWNKIFTLKDKNDSVDKQYKTPEYRSCVHCKSIIKHESGCKHMNCKKKECGKSFCWVCLAIPQGTKYKCDGTFDYCGFIAGVQTIK